MSVVYEIEIDISKASKLGDFMRGIMDRKDLSIEEVARAGGISPSTLNQILGGSIAVPPERRLRGFARILGVSLDSLKDKLPAQKAMNESDFDMCDHFNQMADIYAKKC